MTACIGPSICQDCYEVGEEVIAEFAAAFREEHHPALFYKKENGKYQLDLWRGQPDCSPGSGRAGDRDLCDGYLYPLQSRAFVFPPDVGRPAGKSLCIPLLKGRRQIAGPGFAKNDI